MGAVAARVEDACARLDGAEERLEAAGRGVVSTRLRVEQLHSLADARIAALAEELAEAGAASRQAAPAAPWSSWSKFSPPPPYAEGAV